MLIAVERYYLQCEANAWPVLSTPDIPSSDPPAIFPCAMCPASLPDGKYSRLKHAHSYLLPELTEP